MKYLSCKDIESSLYIAPNEVRSCCQRFFFDGEMRGDAKLLEIEEGKTPTSDDIINAREKLFSQIQKKKSKSCNGCPFLYETNKKPKFSNEVKHLSIEHHSYCNLRCNYCSPIYYGGKRSKYDVIQFIEYLNTSGSFKNCKQVVWGGGEPTLDKSFDLIIKEIHKNANPDLYHRVFTNSVRYHPTIEKLLKQGLIKIVTSVDAGTKEKFKLVRGRDRFEQLFQNLKKYSNANSNRVTIKYILTEDNLDEIELDAFVKNCVKNDLANCCYQISMNYKNEELSLSFLKALLYLMSKFKENKIEKFFTDDHIAARFKKLNDKMKSKIFLYIKEKNLSNIIFNEKNFSKINIYGAGDIAKNIILKNMTNFDNSSIEVYDSDPDKIGTFIGGIKIKKPEKILENTNKIFISAAQSYDDIYTSLLKMRVEGSRIVSGIFL
tara:strand:- start:129 stop:1430 length:1302 start_codon:yes stop_codon:yes gene_type:complete